MAATHVPGVLASLQTFLAFVRPLRLPILVGHLFQLLHFCPMQLFLPIKKHGPNRHRPQRVPLQRAQIMQDIIRQFPHFFLQRPIVFATAEQVQFLGPKKTDSSARRFRTSGQHPQTAPHAVRPSSYVVPPEIFLNGTHGHQPTHSSPCFRPTVQPCLNHGRTDVSQFQQCCFGLQFLEVLAFLLVDVVPAQPLNVHDLFVQIFVPHRPLKRAKHVVVRRQGSVSTVVLLNHNCMVVSHVSFGLVGRVFVVEL